jgi:hypothetical protein
MRLNRIGSRSIILCCRVIYYEKPVPTFSHHALVHLCRPSRRKARGRRLPVIALPARRAEKKPAPGGTGYESFRRGCLKGTLCMCCILKCCKCEVCDRRLRFLQSTRGGCGFWDAAGWQDTEITIKFARTVVPLCRSRCGVQRPANAPGVSQRGTVDPGTSPGRRGIGADRVRLGAGERAESRLTRYDARP